MGLSFEGVRKMIIIVSGILPTTTTMTTSKPTICGIKLHSLQGMV